MNRRQFIYGTAAVAGPVLGGCDNDDEPIVSIDENYPVGPFGATSTAEEVTVGLDLTGKTAMVTGCNSGLGFETMRVLAMRGAHVIGTGRNLEKASKPAQAYLEKRHPWPLSYQTLIQLLNAVIQSRSWAIPLIFWYAMLE